MSLLTVFLWVAIRSAAESLPGYDHSAPRTQYTFTRQSQAVGQPQERRLRDRQAGGHNAYGNLDQAPGNGRSDREGVVVKGVFEHKVDSVC